MVKRALKRRKHNPTGAKGNIVTTRCGLEIKRPKEGGMPANVAAFGWDCTDCQYETDRILGRLTTEVATT